MATGSPQETRDLSLPERGDLRLYVPRPAGWEVRIMTSGQREYCHSKNPGEDHFHLIVPGEIYLQRGEERYCLNCAYRSKIITTDRLFWQRG